MRIKDHDDEDDGTGDSGCDVEGDWLHGATASSSMIPRIRLYTASGKCLWNAIRTRRRRGAVDVPLFQSLKQGDGAIPLTIAQFSAEHGFPCRRLG